MKADQHIMTASVPSIVSNIECFDHALSKELNSAKIEDKSGPYVILHHKINIEQYNITVEVYTTGSIVIKGSPYIPDDKFEDIAKKVIEIAKNSRPSVADERSITLVKAKGIMSYTLSLDLSDEYQRMVAVVLSDLVNEIVLTEIMKNNKITGPALEEGVPKKIKRLKEKGVVIYLEDKIKEY